MLIFHREGLQILLKKPFESEIVRVLILGAVTLWILDFSTAVSHGFVYGIKSE